MITGINFKINLVFINLLIFVISGTLSIILFIILKKVLTNFIKKNNFL